MTPTSLARTLGSPYLSTAAYEFASEHVHLSLVVTDAMAYAAMTDRHDRARP